MEIFMLFFFAAILVGTFFFFFHMITPFRNFCEKLRGKKVIYIEGISSAVNGEFWKSYVDVTPFGKSIAYRYPSYRIGIVHLNDDGTGEYCGKIRWKEV